MCYVNGDGVRQNDVEAVKWWRKAAEQGNEDAKNVLKKLEETAAQAERQAKRDAYLEEQNRRRRIEEEQQQKCETIAQYRRMGLVR